MMGEVEKLEAFKKFLLTLGVPDYVDAALLYSAYTLAYDGAKSLPVNNGKPVGFSINPISLALYLVNEHIFYLSTHEEKKQEDLSKDDNYISFLASVSLDKYFTNEHLAYRMGKLTSRFSPYMSTMDLYLNFILGMLSRYKKNDPRQTLIVDVMTKGFQMAKCVGSLLEGGFETEAFATWRTLHENECILSVLVKSGQPAIESYLRHMKYATAFRGGLETKEATDAVFVEIKSEMKRHDLKSKDMKRFIEYGWLLPLGNGEGEEIKLNFRDGVEKMAGLSNYAKVYEMSSEIAHSSPLLIYSRKDYIFHVVILNLYESFFRLEKIFTSIYMSTIQEEEKAHYIRMRKLYYWEIIAAYKQIQSSFAQFTNSQKPASRQEAEGEE